MQYNLYQAPLAKVADPVSEPVGDDEFLGIPQRREADAGVRWLRDAWTLFKASPGMWIVLTVALVGGAAALQRIPIVGNVIPGLLYPFLTAGLMFGCDALSRGKTLRFQHLFAGFGAPLVPLLVFSLLYFVVSSAASAAVLIPMLGVESYLGILSGNPGDIDGAFWLAILISSIVSIPIVAAYWLAVPLIALNRMDPLLAIRLSLLGCLKNVLPLIVLGLLCAFLMFAAAIPLGLGLLVVLPMLMISMYSCYHDVFYRRQG